MEESKAPPPFTAELRIIRAKQISCMIDVETVRKLALSFEDVVELPHFDLSSFRVSKKIFATMDIKRKRVCVKLSLVDQSVFCGFDKSIIYPVPNKWGKNGATFIELKKVRKDIFKDVLTVSYCTVAPKKLAAKYRSLPLT